MKKSELKNGMTVQLVGDSQMKKVLDENQHIVTQDQAPKVIEDLAGKKGTIDGISIDDEDTPFVFRTEDKDRVFTLPVDAIDLDATVAEEPVVQTEQPVATTPEEPVVTTPEEPVVSGDANAVTPVQ